MKYIDPNLPVENFQIFYEKSIKTKRDCQEDNRILDELLTVEAKPRKQYNILYSKYNL